MPKNDSTAGEDAEQADSSSKSQVIRDFIYLDVERLNSIYAQVFEGTVEEMHERLVREATTPEANPDRDDQQGSMNRAQHESEKKVMHDYMYSHLEEELGEALREPPYMKGDFEKENDLDAAINVPEGQNVYKEQDFVRVTGYPAMLDYKEMKEVLDNWGKLQRGITEHDPQFAAAKKASELRQQFQENPSPSEEDRDEMAKRIRRLDEVAGDTDGEEAFPSAEAMSFLAFLLETFYGDALEVIVNREKDDAPISFRATLQRQWLRVALQRLKLLYGGSLPGLQWTMVGHITHNPLAGGEAKKANEAFESSIPGVGDLEGNFRDRIRNMVSAFNELEEHTVRSENSIEFHLMPLAIYRETKMAGFDESLLEELESENV